jgi:hypothetical protein
MRPRSLAALALLIVPALVPAQRRPQVGILLGASRATFVGDDAGDLDHRDGFVAGVSAVVPLGGGLALQPELHFAQKGARIPEDRSPPGRGALRLRFDYLEAPLLLRYAPPIGGSVRPHLLVGPTVAWRVQCEARNADGDAGCTGDSGLTEFPRRGDIGASIGAGIDLPLGTLTGTASLRYTRGFRDVVDDFQVRNQVLQLLFGVRF